MVLQNSPLRTILSKARGKRSEQQKGAAKISAAPLGNFFQYLICLLDAYLNKCACAYFSIAAAERLFAL